MTLPIYLLISLIFLGGDIRRRVDARKVVIKQITRRLPREARSEASLSLLNR